MSGEPPENGARLPLAEAARYLGISVEALRKRIATDPERFQPVKGNDRRVTVWLSALRTTPEDRTTAPPEDLRNGSGDWLERAALALEELRKSHDADRVEAAQRLDAAHERTARAESELRLIRRRAEEAEQRAALLTSQIEKLTGERDQERARGDRLEAEARALAQALAELRRPWLARVLEALRPKES
jgi:hypothetical protein